MVKSQRQHWCPGRGKKYLKAVAKRTTSVQLSKSRSAAMKKEDGLNKKMEDK
jgi:hypothetical protein